MHIGVRGEQPVPGQNSNADGCQNQDIDERALAQPVAQRQCAQADNPDEYPAGNACEKHPACGPGAARRQLMTDREQRIQVHPQRELYANVVCGAGRETGGEGGNIDPVEPQQTEPAERQGQIAATKQAKIATPCVAAVKK